MGFWKEVKTAVKQEWQKMTTSDKVKIGARILCSIGSGTICGTLARKYIESEKPGTFKTAAVLTTAVGLSWVASDKAYDAWRQCIDVYSDLKQSYNELGDEKEAEEVVG